MNPTAGVQAPTGAPQWPEGIRFAHIEALAVEDGAGVSIAPGALLLEVGGVRGSRLRGPVRVLAVGTPVEVARHPAAGSAHRVALPESVLIPGLVNAHTHLDLTAVGPRPFARDAGFMGWIDMVRRLRPQDTDAIARSVGLGIELSLAGGSVAVGDIAGAPGGRPSLIPFRVLGESDLAGISFLEFFAIGRGEVAGLARAQEAVEASGGVSGNVRFGVQPHAPNTVSLRGYEWAAGLGVPLATHLAETTAEREFIAHATGPQRDLLEALGLWDAELLGQVGLGRRPVQHLASILEDAQFSLAHVNDASDDDISLLARTGQRVVYCPRAGEYFGNQEALGAHRYREMLDAGIAVALGTDSIINLPAVTAAEPACISVLDEMRLLWRRDGTDPRVLLSMATLNGAAALGLEPGQFGFTAGGRLLGLVGVDVRGTDPALPALQRVLESRGNPYLLLAGK